MNDRLGPLSLNRRDLRLFDLNRPSTLQDPLRLRADPSSSIASQVDTYSGPRAQNLASSGPPRLLSGTLDGGSDTVNRLGPGAWAPGGAITLDPSRAYDVGYIKQVMAQTARALGNPPPTQKDYDYWIPKILAIGGKGLDGYWLQRLLTPDTGGGGGGGGGGVGSAGASSDDDEIEAEIRAILQDPNNDDKTANQKIQAVLKKHGRPTGQAPAGGTVVTG